MTKNIFSLLMLAVALVWTGCQSDEDLSPIATFDKAGKGAYPRLLSISAGEFDLQDFSEPIDYTVEFVSIDQGANVAEYTVSVSFVDNNPDNGDMSVDAQVIRTFTQADFADNENGFKQVDVSLNAVDMANSLGIDADMFLSGDFFDMSGRITLDDGSFYTFDNTTASINQGGAFAGYFASRYTLTCPISDDRFVGTYSVALNEDYAGGGFGPVIAEGEVELTLVDGSSTRRQLSFTYLPDLGGFAETMTISFECDQILNPFNGGIYDTGLACAGGSLGVQIDNSPFDFDDDSGFVISALEHPDGWDGGCGLSPIASTWTFTKL